MVVQLVCLDAFIEHQMLEFLESLTSSTQVIVSFLAMQEKIDLPYTDLSYARNMAINTHAGPSWVAEVCTERLQALNGGTFVGVSSVAGDRGRPGNYLYGAAKAAHTAYLSGLRSRLYSHRGSDRPVNVLTVNPGVIRTPATEQLAFPDKLLGNPKTVARDIANGIATGRNVIYTPWPWYFVMKIINLIPEPIFKRLNF